MRRRVMFMFSLAVALSIDSYAAPRPGENSAAKLLHPATLAQVQLLHAQGQIYMLAGPTSNATVQVGQDGLLFVDTPDPELVPAAMALIRSLGDKPVRYIVNTSLDANYVSGDQALIRFGTRKLPPISGSVYASAPVAAAGAVDGVSILAQENVFNRLTASDHAPYPGAVITSTYFQPSKDFFLNGEGIVVYHVAHGHTDGDSIVHFRQSDVVSTGALFTPGHYPNIDVPKGGSVDGLLAGLNFILSLTIPADFQEGGTQVIPGYGRLCNEADVVEYRDMVSIIRDRVQDMRTRGMTLAQVQAARPTFDYDTEYAGAHGGINAQSFVKSIYDSLNPTGGASR